MPNKMLIDATHPEETRVVVVRGNRVEEFDYESANRKQLRGNIYLAKVTRVEPSLQAAFIEYGGNRHGFLAFSEIHPDYYQIPTADRQALLDDEARAHRDEEDEQDRRSSRRNRGRHRSARRRDEAVRSEPIAENGDVPTNPNLESAEPQMAENAVAVTDETVAGDPSAELTETTQIAASADVSPADHDIPDTAGADTSTAPAPDTGEPHIAIADTAAPHGEVTGDTAPETVHSDIADNFSGESTSENHAAAVEHVDRDEDNNGHDENRHDGNGHDENGHEQNGHD
jgi:ribonuclease E